jgi:hypothetical protein
VNDNDVHFVLERLDVVAVVVVVDVELGMVLRCIGY